MHTTQFSNYRRVHYRIQRTHKVGAEFEEYLISYERQKALEGTGTSAEGRDALFDRMINAFDMAIASDHRL